MALFFFHLFSFQPQSNEIIFIFFMYFRYVTQCRPANLMENITLLLSYYQPNELDVQPILHLTPKEVDDLVAFLEFGLYDLNLNRYVPESVFSEQCFPNNDGQSRVDWGCD